MNKFGIFGMFMCSNVSLLLLYTGGVLTFKYRFVGGALLFYILCLDGFDVVLFCLYNY